MVLRKFDLKFLVLAYFVSNDIFDLPDLVSLRPFLVPNLFLYHFLNVFILL